MTTYKVDDQIRVLVGFPDGHIEVEVDLPFPLSMFVATAKRTLSAEAVLRLIPMIREAMHSTGRAKCDCGHTGNEHTFTLTCGADCVCWKKIDVMA